MNIAVSVSAQSLNQGIAARAFNRLLARRIDIGDDHGVRIVEALTKFDKQA